MRLLTLALKDLQQVMRDWKSALFLLLMPILFTLFFGFVFGKPLKDPRVDVGFLNLDREGELIPYLESWLDSSDLVRLVSLEGKDSDQVDRMVNRGEIIAALVIPEGFSRRAIEGSPLPVTITTEGTPAGRAAGTYLQTEVKRLLGAVQAAQLSTAALEKDQTFISPADRQAGFDDALALALASWKQPPLTVSRRVAGVLAAEPETASGFLQASPGMLVQFSVFSLITSSMVLVVERKNRVLERLLTTPITPGEVIAGHALAMFLIGFLQQALLVIFGQFLFGVNYFHSPVGTLLLMACLALWVASLGLLIGSTSRVEEQVILKSLIVMFAFSALGGAWFPLEIAGKTFAAIAHFTPTAWAMDGFQNIVLRGLGLHSALLPAGILMVYTIGFFLVAVWRFKFE